MSILATTTLFYTHAWETYLIGGLLIFLIGLCAGWILWRHCHTEAQRVEKTNATLRKHYSELKSNHSALDQIISDFPQDPAA